MLRLFARGYNQRETAELLTVSPHTVANYVTLATDRLDLPHSTALLRWAIKCGLDEQACETLIDPDPPPRERAETHRPAKAGLSLARRI